ncbi:MAG: hypothetical protein LLF96_01015 [Eubacteriales bacterium]|nr:hypothetical protein [Eubacteriales bacterium]
MPIMVILPTLNTSAHYYSIPWELILAGCTFITLPLIIVFPIFQKQYEIGSCINLAASVFDYRTR